MRAQHVPTAQGSFRFELLGESRRVSRAVIVRRAAELVDIRGTGRAPGSQTTSFRLRKPDPVRDANTHPNATPRRYA